MKSKPDHVLMARDALTLVEEVWCTFETREELVAAREALNRLYDGAKSFWDKDDEPPHFAKDVAAFEQFRRNWRS